MSAATALSVAEPPKSRNLQIALIAALAIAMASYFWIDSRYPALLKKLHAGRTIKVGAAMSFDAVLPVKPEMPLGQRIVRTSGNWLWANRVGMSFGMGFGAVLLTLLPLLSRRRFRSPLGNTVLGVATGAPLGVCACCVAPVGRGLALSGASSNTVLATIISSPTLNIIVLSMSFTLFPLSIGLLKLATVVGLLLLIPWMAPKQEAELACELPATVSASSAFTLFLRNLWKIVAVTLPVTFLAALLGATVAETMPASAIPSHASVLGVVIVALVATFLPVPMAFDVALAFVLMTRGVPLPYVVAVLCTLGVYSIYSALVLGSSVSWKTSIKMYGAVAGLGAIAGLVTMTL